MLGERLRELRLRRGMTLRELAEAADVSPGMLSQLENGITDPSLNTLRRLASVFQSEVAALFREPDAPLVHISRPGDRTRLTAPSGQITYERITPGRGDLEVLRAELAPGDVSAPGPRSHESTECVVVLSGTVVVEIGKDRYVLIADEALTFDSGLAHRYCNESDAPAVMLLSITPPVP